MNSCLYECELWHARLEPVRHRFGYRIFLFALDLDELDHLHDAVPLLSIGARNLYSFRQHDYLPTGNQSADADSSLKRRVLSYAARHGVELANSRVVLVTLPRVAGYLFNPVSFYFCYDESGAAVAAIAEVTNTFKEVKPYFIPLVPSDSAAARFHLRIPKYFYVSPFSDVDVEFEFQLAAPGERLVVQIDDYTSGRRSFSSSLRGECRALTGARLLWYTLKYPLISLQIIALIHWHALRLWAKRAPWFPKAARPQDQCQLYRAHSSLTPTSSSSRFPVPPEQRRTPVRQAAARTAKFP